MATTIPTKLKFAQVDSGSTAPAGKISFDSATFLCLLVVAGTGAPNTTNSGVQSVADVTGSNAEVTGTGYSRQTLTGVTLANDGTITTQVDWSFGDITFAQNAAGFTNARYAILYTTSIGSADASYPVVAVCDLGANQSVQAASLVLTCPAGGLIQWA